MKRIVAFGRIGYCKFLKNYWFTNSQFNNSTAHQITNSLNIEFTKPLCPEADIPTAVGTAKRRECCKVCLINLILVVKYDKLKTADWFFTGSSDTIMKQNITPKSLKKRRL